MLLLFAGILFAALLDACTRGLQRVAYLSDVPGDLRWSFWCSGSGAILALGWGALSGCPPGARADLGRTSS
ncbi:MAG: hypothetical protein U1E60_03825 [Reyranellaceae bacterium]